MKNVVGTENKAVIIFPQSLNLVYSDDGMTVRPKSESIDSCVPMRVYAAECSKLLI